MDPEKGYRFCNQCGNKIVNRAGNRLTCLNNHHLYINPIPSNAVIIENNKGMILLVKRKFPPKKGWWDLPGGFMQPHETLEESAIREIKEELGVDIKIIRLVGIYPDTYLYQSILEPTLTAVFLAKIKAGKLAPNDDITSFKLFPKDNILKQKIAFKSAVRGIKDHLTAKLKL